MSALAKKIDVIVKNSFAFGGISATLVCKKI
jgi:3-oxoacyl-(acyl-carrier-protein) synthase